WRHRRSPPFPYTTLFRSAAAAGHVPGAGLRAGPHGRQLRAERPRPGRDEDDAHAGEHEALARGLGGAADGDDSGADTWPGGPSRSEEHTSELQSLAYLVC